MREKCPKLISALVGPTGFGCSNYAPGSAGLSFRVMDLWTFHRYVNIPVRSENAPVKARKASAECCFLPNWPKEGIQRIYACDPMARDGHNLAEALF